MKKLIYTLIAVSIVFAGCKKEDEVVLPTVISGCTDVLAQNYNSDATVDNGFCTYTTGISGCMDTIATNYDATATTDDGSCTYGLTGGIWSAINVIIDSTITVTVGGILDPTQSGSGSETLTAEDSESPTSIEFLSNDTVYALHSYDPQDDNTSTYSISGSTLTINASEDEDQMNFEYTVDKTTLTLVMSIDTSVSMPPVEISASFSQTMNFNRE